jgi:hypothetical protein
MTGAQEPATQPSPAMAKVGLEPRLRHPERPTAIGESEPALHRRHRRIGITESVLAQLGRLDGGDDRGPARTDRDRVPRLERLVDAVQPAQEMRPVDGDALVVPGARERLPAVPADRDATWHWRAAEICTPSRGPPRLLRERTGHP